MVTIRTLQLKLVYHATPLAKLAQALPRTNALLASLLQMCNKMEFVSLHATQDISQLLAKFAAHAIQHVKLVQAQEQKNAPHAIPATTYNG